MRLSIARTKCPSCCGDEDCTVTNQLCSPLPTYEELYDFYKNCNKNIGSPIYGNDANNPPVRGRFKLMRACLRFYYRVVNEDLAGGTVFCEGPIGPEGVRRGKEVLETILGYRNDKPSLFNGESCGFYIYPIRFYSWYSTCTTSPISALGGAQYINDEKTLCGTIRIYNIDAFSICGN